MRRLYRLQAGNPGDCRALSSGQVADTDLAVECLREVLERSDTPEELLLGLRRIAEAQCMSRVTGLKLSVRPAV